MGQGRVCDTSQDIQDDSAKSFPCSFHSKSIAGTVSQSLWGLHKRNKNQTPLPCDANKLFISRNRFYGQFNIVFSFQKTQRGYT